MRSSVVRWREATRSSSSLTRRARARKRQPRGRVDDRYQHPVVGNRSNETEIDRAVHDELFTRERGVQEFELRECGEPRPDSRASRPLMATPSRVERPSASSLAKTAPSASMATKPCGVTWAETAMCCPIRRRPLESATTISFGRTVKTARSASRSGNRASRTAAPKWLKVQLPPSARIRRTTGDTTTPLTGIGEGRDD